ncbi:MAG: ABC transporter ATP-binding protein [Oscillibacter sp.]
MGELQGAAAAAERVLDLLEEAAEPGDGPDAVEPKNLKGDIRFDHVHFGYTDQPVLRDFCAHIPAGSLAAVVGPTGAGKTTLVSLLLRFYTPQSGSITIDGLPVTAYSRDGLRRRLALVLQDTWLFGGSIAENIAYGAPSATREQVVECAKAAHIHRFISSLPAGYDTVLTDEGAGISKGQRQLLAIARCLLTDADIVILDEATSNVDTETEGEISLAMERLRQGRTCFVIAHRLATIRNADRILVLSQGGAVEQGTHEELLAAGGVYAGLYAAQFD